MSTFEYRVEDVTHELRCVTKDDENKYYYHVNLHLKSTTSEAVKVIYVEIQDDKAEDDPFPCAVSYLYTLRNAVLWGRDSCLMLETDKFGFLTDTGYLSLAQGTNDWLEQLKERVCRKRSDALCTTEGLTDAELAIIQQPGFSIEALGEGDDDDTPYQSLLTSNTAYIGMEDVMGSQLLLAKALNTLNRILRAKTKKVKSNGKPRKLKE